MCVLAPMAEARKSGLIGKLYKTKNRLRMLSSCRRLRVSFPRLSSHLLAFELLSQLTFEAFLLSRLDVEGVFLGFLDNAFLLNLTLEAPKGALNGLTFEHPNLGQSMPPQYVRSSREYEGPVPHKATGLFSDALGPS